MQTPFRHTFKRLTASCALSMAALAAPSLLCPALAATPASNASTRAANFDGEWNVQLRCTPWGQGSNTWVLAKMVAVKNNRGDYSITGEKFFAKGAIVFRDSQVAIDHMTTKTGDESTFWTLKQQGKPLDVNTFQLSAIANGAGHDAGEAQCVVIGTRQAH